MAIELKQTVKMSQQLMITPQLQQAIKLLQMSRAELVETVQKELLENPVLEEPEDVGVSMEGASRLSDLSTPSSASELSENPLNTSKEFDWASYVESAQRFGRESRGIRNSPDEVPNYENFVAEASNLSDYLLWQISMAELMPNEEKICREIMGNLDDNGYLMVPLEDISQKSGYSVEELEDALCLIQDLDPPGVGARNLEECLLLQVKNAGADTHYLQAIIKEHLDLLEKRNYPALAKKLGVTPHKASELANIIFALEPKPGRSYAQNDTRYIQPDIYVAKVGDDYVVSLNEDGLPRLQISNLYKSAIINQKNEDNFEIGGSMDKKAKDYISEKLKNALWLIKSIHQRQKTLYRVTKAIVEYQKEFFDRGVQFMKPLVLRDIADEIGVHESTVSRATNGKYVHTPQGIFELKYFFNTGLSQSGNGDDIANEVVKEKIRQLVAKEDPKKPLSDQSLMVLLKKQNVDVARRTIAKYRELMGILPSSRRRRLN